MKQYKAFSLPLLGRVPKQLCLLPEIYTESIASLLILFYSCTEKLYISTFTIAFNSFPLGFSLNESTLPLLSIFIKPKSEARLSWKEIDGLKWWCICIPRKQLEYDFLIWAYMVMVTFCCFYFKGRTSFHCALKACGQPVHNTLCFSFSLSLFSDIKV